MKIDYGIFDPVDYKADEFPTVVEMMMKIALEFIIYVIDTDSRIIENSDNQKKGKP